VEAPESHPWRRKDYGVTVEEVQPIGIREIEKPCIKPAFHDGTGAGVPAGPRNGEVGKEYVAQAGDRGSRGTRPSFG
jgi:hypothetical protein